MRDLPFASFFWNHGLISVDRIRAVIYCTRYCRKPRCVRSLTKKKSASLARNCSDTNLRKNVKAPRQWPLWGNPPMTSAYWDSKKNRRYTSTWCRHQIETLSALMALCAGNSRVTGEFLSQKWRGALMFSLVCAWINGWVKNHEAVDLRRHRAHYDVIVMI